MQIGKSDPVGGVCVCDPDGIEEVQNAIPLRLQIATQLATGMFNGCYTSISMDEAKTAMRKVLALADILIDAHNDTSE